MTTDIGVIASVAKQSRCARLRAIDFDLGPKIRISCLFSAAPPKIGGAGLRASASAAGTPHRRSAGGVEGDGVFEVVEEGAGGLHVGGVEPFGEPAEDWREKGDRLLRPALLSAQAGEARRGAQ